MLRCFTASESFSMISETSQSIRCTPLNDNLETGLFRGVPVELSAFITGKEAVHFLFA